MTIQDFWNGCDAVKSAKLTKAGLDSTVISKELNYQYFLEASDEFASKLVNSAEASVYSKGQFWPAVEALCADPLNNDQRTAAVDNLVGFLKLPVGKTITTIVNELILTWAVYFQKNVQGLFKAETVLPEVATTNETKESAPFNLPVDAKHVIVRVKTSGVGAGESVVVKLKTAMNETYDVVKDIATITGDGTTEYIIDALGIAGKAKVSAVVTGTVTLAITALPKSV